jgi:hypothetical protein
LKSRLFARLCAATLLLLFAAAAVQAQQHAAGLTALPKHAKVVIAPLDVQLFSLSAGGQPEPRADWTDAAKRHITAALRERASSMELAWSEMSEQTAAEHVELMHLHDLVADAISMHSAASTRLPTKNGRLEWSFGDAMHPLQAATGARYGLFVYLRDSYATTERKAMIGVVALLSAATSGGASLLMLNAGLQDGEATLIDLETGEVLWFNEMRSRSGDVREAAPAADTVKALLAGFPETR